MALLLSGHATVTPQGDRIQRDDQRPACAAEWETRWRVRIVDASSVQAEGLPRGTLPPIEAPMLVDVESAGGELMATSPMARLRHGGEVVGYPLQILAWHRALNGVVGGEPVLVLYCPLSDRVEAYRRRVAGQELRFAATGMVHRGASLFFDTDTQSLWRPFDGKCVVGDFVGAQLERLPLARSSWREFVSQYPTAQVLSRETGFLRAYERSPLPEFDRAVAAPTLFDAPDRRLPAMERVIAVQSAKELTVYPLSPLETRRVYEDERGGDPFVLLWTPWAASLLNYELLTNARDVGTAVAYKRPAVNGRLLSFVPHREEAQLFMDSETQSSWNVFGAAVAGPLAGKALPAVPFETALWFALAAARPDASPMPRLRVA